MKVITKGKDADDIDAVSFVMFYPKRANLWRVQEIITGEEDDSDRYWRAFNDFEACERIDGYGRMDALKDTESLCITKQWQLVNDHFGAHAQRLKQYKCHAVALVSPVSICPMCGDVNRDMNRKDDAFRKWAALQDRLRKFSGRAKLIAALMEFHAMENHPVAVFARCHRCKNGHNSGAASEENEFIGPWLMRKKKDGEFKDYAALREMRLAVYEPRRLKMLEDRNAVHKAVARRYRKHGLTKSELTFFQTMFGASALTKLIANTQNNEHNTHILQATG